MKANELRIGNWLRWDGDYAQWNLYNFKDLEFTDSYIEAEPIPITEEWLLKFGFEKDYDSYTLIYDSWLGFSIDVEDFSLGFTEMGKLQIAISDSPKYVHQLQNLYFSLTGQELSYE